MVQTRPPRLAIFFALLMLLLGAPLAHAQTTPTSIQLTWTTPGDDGNLGTASQFDLRYSTSTITASNFNSATRWMGTPTPTAPGTSQTTTVTGLTPATQYYFAIKTGDNVPNWSAISNVAIKSTLAAPDVTPPAPLAITVSQVNDTTATLTWTATGDDSVTGTARTYDVRYSTSLITLANWNAAAQASGEPTPGAAGTPQSFMVRNLSREQTYYFAIRVSDEVPNVSGLSNVPLATTPDNLPPSAILNLTANFMWLSWHAVSAGKPRVDGGR